MKINAEKLRARVAELLLEHAVMMRGVTADDALYAAAKIERGETIHLHMWMHDVMARAAQDVAGVGHYDEARRIIEGR